VPFSILKILFLDVSSLTLSRYTLLTRTSVDMDSPRKEHLLSELL